MIRFECPGCGALFAVAENQAGKTGKCPTCHAPFRIPQPEPTAAAPGDPTAPVEVAPCPGCQVRLSVAPADLDNEVECPYCQTRFLATPLTPPREEGTEPPRERRRDDRPSRRRRSRRDDDEEDDEDDRPRRRRRRRKPGEVTAIGGMLLGGGIYALVFGAGLAVGSTGICCLWPGTYLALVWGILAIIRGAAMLGPTDNQGAPRTLLILQIVTIVNFDIVNCVLGIIGLVLLNSPDVRDYYDRLDRD